MAREKAKICILHLIHIRDILVRHQFQGQPLFREIIGEYIVLSNRIAFVKFLKDIHALAKAEIFLYLTFRP
jgi:hypothetical protein